MRINALIIEELIIIKLKGYFCVTLKYNNHDKKNNNTYPCMITVCILLEEDLISLKDKFKSTVSSFEKKKETANKNVTKGLETLHTLKTTLLGCKKNED